MLALSFVRQSCAGGDSTDSAAIYSAITAYGPSVISPASMDGGCVIRKRVPRARTSRGWRLATGPVYANPSKNRRV